MRNSLPFLICAAFLLSCTAPSPSSSTGGKTLTIKGSDTMIILTQRWAEEYMKKYPGRIVQVTGGGSGTGIACLITGGTDICMSSRSITKAEIEKIRQTRHAETREIPVAADGIGIYVHRSNPVNELSLSDLKEIFQGLSENWKAFGGTDLKIVPYGRESSSGTFAFFMEHVLHKEDFAPEVQALPGTAAIVNAVSKHDKAIGYGGVGFAVGVKELRIRRGSKDPAYAPNEASVISGRYPLSRNLFFYTAGVPSGDVKHFIDFSLSPEGQAICKQSGYYPIMTGKARP